MSRAGQITGSILGVIVLLLAIAGWRLFTSSNTEIEKQEHGTKLLDAITRKDYLLVNKLLDRGFDVNYAAPTTQETCLMAACIDPDRELLERLTGMGADKNATDNKGATALAYLLFNGNNDPALVRLLMPDPAHLRGLGQGSSPLALAIGQKNPEIVLLLLANGANPNEKDMRADPVLSQAVGNEDFATVTALLDHGATVNTPSGRGVLPLETALTTNNDAIASLLVQRGASIDKMNASGMTPLIAAVDNNMPKAVAALLARGAPVDAKDKAGETALIVAVRQEKVDFVKQLLKHHPNLAIQDASHRTAAMWAVDQGNHAMSNLVSPR